MTVYTDLFRYRELFGNLFRRDLQAKYKGSVARGRLVARQPAAADGDLRARLLGALEGRTRSRTTRSTCSPGSRRGSSSRPRSRRLARSLLDNASLIRKTRFPRQLVPLSVVATQLVTFAVMLAVLLVVNFVILPRVRATDVARDPARGAVRRASSAGSRSRRLGERALPRRRAPDRGAAPAVVLPHADPLHASTSSPRSSSTRRSSTCSTGGTPMTPPIEAIRAPLWDGHAARLERRRLPRRRRRRRARARRLGLHAPSTTGSRSSCEQIRPS